MSMRRFLLLTLVLAVAACRSHVAYVYSGVDPAEAPSKSDPISFELPDNASIREKNIAVLLREELQRNGFNLVSDFKESKWTLSFAVDRKTYTIGSTTHGVAVGFGVYGVPVAIGSSNTDYIQQTDVHIYMHLLKTSDLAKPNPMAVWEGSVTTTDRVFSVLPNSTIKNLLDKFGQNFERKTKVDRSYQRDVNASKGLSKVQK